MALVYFDSSALVKLLVDKPGSELAAHLWDGCDASLSSRLAYAEVRAALAVAGRNRDLDEDRLRSAERAWEGFWAAVWPVQLTAAVETRAGQLTGRHNLGGSQAIHLASAMAVETDDLVVAV
ncbi:MAG: type II toxin-antitoxin system VapC family toxin, partial [Acidimicrobiales bacterium]